jgi:ABC-type branched-subunit amino acid transport system ATPase component
MLTIAPDGLAFLIHRLTGPPLERIRRRLPTRARPDPLASTERERDRDRDHDRVPSKLLDLDGITVRFGGVDAVSDLSLQVHAGEVVGLIGPNGAGKSTTIDAITGVVPLAAGTVALDGVRIDRWTRERRARAGIGRSFQSLELFDDLTALENIQTACDDHALSAYATDLVKPGFSPLPEAARDAVVQFGLADVLSVQVRDLHYGQRRLLAIARAIAAAPSILLLDEPAAGLDEQQARDLGDSIRRLASDWGMGILLVEHNVDMVLRSCDRVYALNFGILVGSGTPSAIRSNQAVVDSYLGTARFRDKERAEPTADQHAIATTERPNA